MSIAELHLILNYYKLKYILIISLPIYIYNSSSLFYNTEGTSFTINKSYKSGPFNYLNSGRARTIMNCSKSSGGKLEEIKETGAFERSCS